MPVKKQLLIFGLSFLISALNAQERGLKLWNSNSIEFKINDRFSAGINEKVQYLPVSGSVNQKLGDLFLKLHVSCWLDVGITGRMGWLKEEDDWLQEVRPMAFGNLSAGLGKVELEFSNRVEYRMYKYVDDYFRHRQMLTMETLPVYSLKWFKIFLAEESFFRFDENQVHLARLHTGTKIRYSSHMEMKVFYIIEKSRSLSQWDASDILGLNFNLDF